MSEDVMPDIERAEYDEHGGRWARCTRCGMGWCEYCEPVELFPGEWTHSGEQEHTCPEPMPYVQALGMVQVAEAHGGIIVSQRVKASIKLGLEAGPDAR